MKKREVRHHLLVFSRKERHGILILLLMTVALYLLPAYWPARELPPVSLVWQAINEKQASVQESVAKEAPLFKGYFPFNPNTASLQIWEQLGVDSPLAQRIQHYISKGGKFRQASDLSRIWGMPPAKAAALAPYVRIEAVKREIPAIMPVDLNLADTAALQALPGIGPTLARRIVQYRQQYGSIMHKEELLQVRGVRDSLLVSLDPYLLVNEKHIVKMPLNRATAYLLVLKARLPMILARAIVAQRLLDGPFNSWLSVKAIEGMTAEYLQNLQRTFSIDEVL